MEKKNVVVPRVDLVSKRTCSPHQLSVLPQNHPYLRWFGGRAIALMEQTQLCGNVPFDYIWTLGHSLPKDLQEFEGLFEPYLVFNAIENPRVQWGYKNRSLTIRAGVYGDTGRALRSFTEGSHRHARVASSPNETVWHLWAQVTLSEGEPTNPKGLWSFSASPATPILSSTDHRWYIDRKYRVEGKLVDAHDRGGLHGFEEMKQFPWMIPILERAKETIRQDPRFVQKCKESPFFANRATVL